MTKQFQLGSISTGILDWLRNGDACAWCECGHADDGHCCSQCCDCPDCESDRFETLQESCPPFVYFGTHPGDGADFGFWPDIDSIREEIQVQFSLAWVKDGKYELNQSSVLVEVKFGEITIMDLDHNIL